METKRQSTLNGKSSIYQRSNSGNCYYHAMPTAGTNGHYFSMLDIEHLSEQPPYYCDFPTNERNMSFDLTDITFCDNYGNVRSKRSLATDMSYYQTNSYVTSHNKQPMSRTCSISSEDNQLESIQYNSQCCNSETEQLDSPMKQFNTYNNSSERMCNSNEILCNNSEQLCHNIERMCPSSERLCNNSEQMCNSSDNGSSQRTYNGSPSESPEECRWRYKHPENWDSQDVLDWLFYTAEKRNLDCGKLRAENFSSISGSDLCKLSLEDFERIESEYGRMLYVVFKELRDGLLFSKPQELHNEYMDLDEVFDSKRSQKPLLQMNSDPRVYPYTNNNLPEIPRFPEEMKVNRSDFPYDLHPGYRYGCPSQPLQPLQDFSPFPQPHHRINPCISPNSQFLRRFPSNMPHPPRRCSMHEPSPHQPAIQRRRPGRPRIKSLPTDEEAQREKKVKNQHLWEFIYEVLMNPLYNPQYVRWENQREGIFRFVQSEAVAQLWGSLKNNDNMTYEKLSRAMRHYYKRGILERVEGRRLVYKFSRVAMERVREKRHSVS